MAKLRFKGVMIGSERPETLGTFYAGVFDRPAHAKEGAWYGWQFGQLWFSIEKHSKVTGQASEPQRAILNLETEDVQGEFDRIKAAGATVVREPYGVQGMWIATFADPDGNYFQLVSPYDETAAS